MWVISKARLRSFWESAKGKKAKGELELWYRVVSEVEWQDYADVKATFGARFDFVGDCAVFDICGNDFRLITRMRFRSHKVFVLRVLTHAEYDTNAWKKTCGCFAEPPMKRRSAKQATKPKPADRRRGRR